MIKNHASTASVETFSGSSTVIDVADQMKGKKRSHKTLEELNRKFIANAAGVERRAKTNTMRLSGRSSL